MPKKSSAIIYVDGVEYDVVRASASASTQKPGKKVDTIAVHTQPTRVPKSQLAFPPLPLQQHTPKSHLRNTPKQVHEKAEPSTPLDNTKAVPSFGMVLVGSLWPWYSSSAWLMVLLRSVASPQVWFLAILSLLYLQIHSLLQNTPNQVIVLARAGIDPTKYQKWVLAGLVFLAVLLLTQLFRSLVSSISLQLRFGQLLERQKSFQQCLLRALSTSFEQMRSYLLHCLVILGISMVFAMAYWGILQWQQTYVQGLEIRIAGVFLWLWLVVVAFLYAKHWLQLVMIANITPQRFQKKPLHYMGDSPVRTFLLGAITACLSLSTVVVAITIAYLQLQYLALENTEYLLLVMVSSCTALFFWVSLVASVQHNLWVRYYIWLQVSMGRPRSELYQADSVRDKSPLQVLWVVYCICMVILVYIVVCMYFADPTIQLLERLQDMVPDRIDPLR